MEDLRGAARRARECAVEAAAAALEDKGPDEALSRIWEAWPGANLDDRLAAMRAVRHPDTEPLTRQYPVCVAFRGDSPVEYWDEDRPGKPKPFGLKVVNRRLAALGRRPA
jgi:hypothetical protein